VRRCLPVQLVPPGAGHRRSREELVREGGGISVLLAGIKRQAAALTFAGRPDSYFNRRFARALPRPSWIGHPPPAWSARSCSPRHRLRVSRETFLWKGLT
jgi:hypothetical protein